MAKRHLFRKGSKADNNMFQLGLSTPTYFAGMLISIIPVAVLFLIFNKQIMNNISIGGMKG